MTKRKTTPVDGAALGLAEYFAGAERVDEEVERAGRSADKRAAERARKERLAAANAIAVGQVRTEGQVVAAHHRAKPKKHGYFQPKSRKKRYQRLSVGYVRAGVLANPMTGKVPGAVAAVVPGREEKEVVRKTTAEILAQPVGSEVVGWPSDVEQLSESVYPMAFDFVLPQNEDDWELEKCGCAGPCYLSIADCRWWAEGIGCYPGNCSWTADDCCRRLRLFRGLALFRNKTGIGIRTKRYLPRWYVVGEYAGVLTTKNPGVTSQYTVALSTPTKDNKKVWLSADLKGNMLRYLAHSCEPNCELIELYGRYGPVLAVRVKGNLGARESLPPGAELTILYGSPWFVCVCGAATRKDRDRVGRSALVGPVTGERRAKMKAKAKVMESKEDEDDDEDEEEDESEEEDE